MDLSCIIRVETVLNETKGKWGAGEEVRIWFAGSAQKERQKILGGLRAPTLWSYFDVRSRPHAMMMRRRNRNNKVDLFLDSGAYSAYTQGVEIPIQDYITFIKEHLDVITVYANLDIIAKGPTPADKRIAAEKTLENQKIMEEAGLSPLPVFHVGEPLEYLESYVRLYDYIGLGSMVGQPKSTLVPWLDRCFQKYICDERGMPKVKVHGFGLTSLSLMLTYPWYSVDSTTWIVNSRMGRIFVPHRDRGGKKWVYDENLWTITVSSRSPGRKEAGHIDNISPVKRRAALEYIHEMGYCLGKSRFEKVPQSHELKENEQWAEKKPKDKEAKRLLEIIEEPGLCNKYQLRDEINIIFFQNLEKALPEWPWPFVKKGAKGFEL